MDNLSHSRFRGVGLAVAIGIAYFMAARLGLALRSQVGVAIFWPAAGIATGALIALGSTARLPVTVAVAFASIASSLAVDRNLWLAITFAALDVGGVLLTVWLVKRWFGAVFKLEGLPQVLGFLVACAIAAAVTAAAAAFTISFVEPAAIPFTTWRLWFASCSLGLITVAPLLIGLGDALRAPPPRRELIEGVIALATLAALSAFVISLPPGSWTTALPMALAFPLLLWVAVRCRPVFAATAMFVVTLTVVWSTTFDMGHFGDASVPLADRILAAQTLVLAGTLLALVLAALFSERRRSEAALQKSRERLELALDGAELGTFSVDLTTGRLECDVRAAQNHGHDTSPMTIAELRCFIHPDDIVRMDAALADAKRSGGRWNGEYRVMLPPEHPPASATRWIAVDGSIVRNRQGTPVRLLGVTRDMTERKRAEQALAERNLQLALAGRAVLVGSYTYDVKKGTVQVSEGYAAIHGLPEGATEAPYNGWRARVHPEDLDLAEGLREQAFAERRKEDNAEYRIVLSTGEVRWIETRGSISYDEEGHPERVVGVNIDITERKQTEQQRNILNAELDHRVKNVLATVGAIIFQTQNANAKIEDFVASVHRRIKSLASTHDLLSHTRWHGVSLQEIIRQEFAPYAAGNTDIGGPSITLRPEAAQAMAMVLHELTTNAAKYGALSNQTGRITVRWSWVPNGISHRRLAIDWRETNGPPVSSPCASGYGTSIIRELIPFELNGSVELAFASEGIRCRLEIPADWIAGGEGLAGKPGALDEIA